MVRKVLYVFPLEEQVELDTLQHQMYQYHFHLYLHNYLLLLVQRLVLVEPYQIFFIQDAGAGFFSPPTITVGPPSSVGIGSGSYWFNELVTGNRSNASARVKRWDLDTKILQVGIETGTFLRGETVTDQDLVLNIRLKWAQQTQIRINMIIVTN